VIGTVGVAALLVAGSFEIAAIVNKSAADAKDSCVNKHCTPDGLVTAQRANDFATVGQWVGIGGIVMTAVGVSLVIASPGRRATPRAAPPVSVSGWLLPGSGGLTLRGAL
jgi:hypothetical protein